MHICCHRNLSKRKMGIIIKGHPATRWWYVSHTMHPLLYFRRDYKKVRRSSSVCFGRRFVSFHMVNVPSDPVLGEQCPVKIPLFWVSPTDRIKVSTFIVPRMRSAIGVKSSKIQIVAQGDLSRLVRIVRTTGSCKIDGEKSATVIHRRHPELTALNTFGLRWLFVRENVFVC